jgi:lysozyme family protein
VTPASIDDIVTLILADEGGIADVHDGKGTTYFGQTGQWLAEYELTAPATAEMAAQNYESWLLTTNLALICQQNVLVGYFVVDYAVHSGTQTAVYALQRALGVKVDGIIGRQTVAALTPTNAHRVALEVLAERLEEMGVMLGSAIKDRRQWARGWLGRVARQLRMAGEMV